MAEYGVQCVMIIGAAMMLLWPADSSATSPQVSPPVYVQSRALYCYDLLNT